MGQVRPRLLVWETMGLSVRVWELWRCRGFRNESRLVVPSGPTLGLHRPFLQKPSPQSRGMALQPNPHVFA
jgi:hypothetical protein